MHITSQEQQTKGKNSYTFEDFLAKRESLDWYRDEPFLQKAVQRFAEHDFDHVHQAMLSFSPNASSKWNQLAERVARPEVRPYMLHYDGFNNRIDRVVRPMEIHQLEKEVFGEGLFS